MIYSADEGYDDEATSGLADLRDEHDQRRHDWWAEILDERNRFRQEGDEL